MENFLKEFPKVKSKILHVLYQQWTELTAGFEDDERVQKFDKPEKMDELYELGSIELVEDAKYNYELQYSYRGDLGEYDTTALFIAIDKDWTVSFSGGAD